MALHRNNFAAAQRVRRPALSAFRWMPLLFAASILLSGRGAHSQDSPQAPDELSRLLFDTYLKSPGKINSDTREAAAHIVAERGRESGFWRQVLQELRENNPKSETSCVSVLGRMLEADAAARDAIRRQKDTGDVPQWIPSVHLSLGVVTELLSRAEKADVSRVDPYVIALAQARVPEPADFFRRILTYDGIDSAKFHAALGLAQLGDRSGYAWLVKNCGEQLPSVSNAWPDGVPNLNLGACCLAALQQLTGKQDLVTPQDCQAWWEKTDKTALPKGLVVLESYP